VRYQRVAQGNRNRVDDMKTFDQFSAEEDIEMHPESGDPFLVNMSGVRDIADIKIDTTFAGDRQVTGLILFNDYLRKNFDI